ncbi:MAG: hypothetical protein Q7S76_03740 [bacterium]|nr:hypothetical protein [bacterium]
MDDNERQPFMTRDLYLASTLVTLHFPLIGTDYQQEGVKPRMIGYFKFEETQELREARSQYNQGLLLIEPRAFIQTLQALKADVMNFMNNPNSELNRK